MLRGERLTGWAVAPGGGHVELGFEDKAGQAQSLSLPVELLSALLMTIPRMLRQALDAQFGDGSLRIIHELGGWQLERAAGLDAVMLTMRTPDGFEVTFALPAAEAGNLAATLGDTAGRTRAAAH
jgi:hypothetical protein